MSRRATGNWLGSAAAGRPTIAGRARAQPAGVDGRSAGRRRSGHNPAARRDREQQSGTGMTLPPAARPSCPSSNCVARTRPYRQLSQYPGDRANNVVGRSSPTTCSAASMSRPPVRRAQEHRPRPAREACPRHATDALSIAYNDIGRLTDQLSYGGIQVRLVERRTLTPTATSSISASVRCSTCSRYANRLFNAQRAQVNATPTCRLSAQLCRHGALAAVAPEAGRTRGSGRRSDDEMTPQLGQLCPPIAPTASSIDRESLNTRALRSDGHHRQPDRQRRPAAMSQPRRGASGRGEQKGRSLLTRRSSSA